jgi:hypothetical protein
MDAYVLAISVKDSKNLPTRAKNVLKRLGCETLEDVTKLTPEQILRSKWAGKKVLAYIKLWLDSFGLTLSDSNLTMPTSAGFPLLNGYNLLRKRIYEYFGYDPEFAKVLENVGDDLPIQDCTDRAWSEFSSVGIQFASTYRGKDFTMIVSGAPQKKVLCIYDNAKEFKTDAAKGGI